jgi:hypothetical protein
MSMTNVCSSVILCLVIELKGKWSIRQRRRFHSTPIVFVGTPHRSPLWCNLHSYFCVCQRGRKFEKGAYISLTSIRFWRFMPKGEKVWAQSKRIAPPPYFKNEVFQINILLCSKGGENSIFKICKTLLNTKRRILFRGEFCFSQRKSIWDRGRKFQILKMLSSILFIYLWLFAKWFWKEFYKGFAKTKLVVQCGPKL